MCEQEYNSTSHVWNETWYRALKPHVCGGCEETIDVGLLYRKTSVLWDGSWGNWKHCARCVAILTALREELTLCKMDDLFSTETLDMRCGETWEHVFDNAPAPSVAALAFVPPCEQNELARQLIAEAKERAA